MQSTGNKSMRAAMFVFVCLLAALITGIVVYFAYAGNAATAVPLLIGCVLIAFVLAVSAIRISVSYRRSRRLELENNVPPSRLLRSLELRQWLILTVGIAFLALATGALTALRIMTADPTTVPIAAPAVGPTTPIAIEPTTEPTTDPTDTEPTDTTGPTDTTDPTDTADPTETPADTPATKYLDTEPALDGGYDANAVSFSAQRYPRGIEFSCDDVTNSTVQWNVAGYNHFTAVAGIDDTTTNAFGALVEFIFYDQDGHQLNGKPIDVSVGHPRKVSFDLKSVVSLRMTCSSRDSKTNEERSTYSALGDPTITQ